MGKVFTECGMTVDVEEVRSHRNGVSGAGFLGILFSWVAAGGESGNRFYATLDWQDFETDKSSGDVLGLVKRGRDITCRVLDLDDPTSKWRGDHFQDALAAAVVDACENETVRY